MTTKKKKFANSLLTTALFTYGFSLEADAVPHTEEQPPTEVCVTTMETEPQHFVENEPTKHKTGQPSPRKATVSPSEIPEEQASLEESEEQTQDSFNELGGKLQTINRKTKHHQSQENITPKQGNPPQ